MADLLTELRHGKSPLRSFIAFLIFTPRKASTFSQGTDNPSWDSELSMAPMGREGGFSFLRIPESLGRSSDGKRPLLFGGVRRFDDRFSGRALRGAWEGDSFSRYWVYGLWTGHGLGWVSRTQLWGWVLPAWFPLIMGRLVIYLIFLQCDCDV